MVDVDVPNWKVLAVVVTVAGAPRIAGFDSADLPKAKSDGGSVAVDDDSALFPNENVETGFGSSAGLAAACPNKNVEEASFFSEAAVDPNEKVSPGFGADPKLNMDVFSSDFFAASPKLKPSFLSLPKVGAGVDFGSSDFGGNEGAVVDDPNVNIDVVTAVVDVEAVDVVLDVVVEG